MTLSRIAGTVLFAAVLVGGLGCSRQPTADVRHVVPRPPRLDPDYAGVTIPPNVAPLNFTVREAGVKYHVHIEEKGGQSIDLVTGAPGIRLPEAPWRRLLASARDGSITWRISVRQQDGTWNVFSPMVQYVGAEPIDPVLLYRRFKPLYSKYVHMGIYQRDLEGFSETPVLRNRSVGGACLNCHTFRAKDPHWFALQTRGAHGLTMLLARNGHVQSVETRTPFNRSPAAYTTWHPSGNLVAFSVNKVSLFYHTRGETRDVFDSASDLAVYSIDDHVLTTSPAISRADSLENWPNWAPDGRHLYFARGPALPVGRYEELRYDLMRVAFDPEKRQFGKVETVLAASNTGLSITQPKVSPDGRWVVVTMADYGNFPVYRRSADLYIVDLETGSRRPLESNSPRTDSWHSWSSNGRWLVFSSKRRDGLFARPYIVHIDSAGHAAKPFVLPQRDPAFYQACVETFNVPELAKGRVPVHSCELAAAVMDTGAVVKARLNPRVERSSKPPEPEPPRPYSSGIR